MYSLMVLFTPMHEHCSSLKHTSIAFNIAAIQYRHIPGADPDFLKVVIANLV